MNIDWRSAALTLAALAAAGAVGAAVTVTFGLYNVSARVGHWPGVSSVLHATFRNSVGLRAKPLAAAPDNLGDPDMVALGAKHYDAACRVCHSAPGQVRTATMRAMTPAPPHITEAVRRWNATELHWIVYQGIKMSGMPPWPAPREHEVWPVVAFLRAVGGMSGESYDRLTLAEKDEGRGIAYCASCHGENGASANPYIPRLDILSETYMTRSLLAYRAGERQSGFMEHAASEVPEAALAAFAARLARIPPRGEAAPVTGEVLRGKRLALAGSADVPACVSCHGPWPEPLDQGFPSLAGQHEPYLATQLRLWRHGNRGGTQAAQLMHHAARDLGDDQIDALAAYYAALAPAELDDARDP